MRNYKERERNGERGRERIRDGENRERKCLRERDREGERNRLIRGGRMYVHLIFIL